MRCTGPVVESLRDGSLVTVRAIRPTDRPLLERGFAQLSPESRYRRFLAPRSSLTDAELDYLTVVDGTNHVAFGVVIEQDGEEEGVGIARFVRQAADPTVAELAIAVLDEYQGRGVGPLLVRCLRDAAIALGVRRFRCDVLASNAGMMKLLDRFGAVVTATTGGTTTLEIDLVTSLG